MATARSIGGKLKLVTCSIPGNAECPYKNNYNHQNPSVTNDAFLLDALEKDACYAST